MTVILLPLNQTNRVKTKPVKKECYDTLQKIITILLYSVTISVVTNTPWTIHNLSNSPFSCIRGDRIFTANNLWMREPLVITIRHPALMQEDLLCNLSMIDTNETKHGEINHIEYTLNTKLPLNKVSLPLNKSFNIYVMKYVKRFSWSNNIWFGWWY